MELVQIFAEQLFGSSISVLYEGAYFFVDFCSHLFAVILVTGNIAAQEYLVLTMAKGYRSDILAHAIFTNHLACQLSCTLQIIASTARNFLQHQGFSHTTTQKHLQLVQHFATSCIILVFLRQAQGITTGTAARNNGNLVHGVGML